MSVWAVLTTVWILSAKTASKDFDLGTLKETVNEIKLDMVTKEGLKVLVDSIRLYNYRIEQKTNTLIKSTNNLRNSYVNYLKRDKTLTLEDFMKFMNGIEWVVSPIEVKPDTIDFKIKVRKKQ